jgi:hypothetical protein
MGRGNANAGSALLASRGGSVHCVIENERDLLALIEEIARQPDPYLHEGAVESTSPVDELAAVCTRSFLASENAAGTAAFRPEEKELVGQAIYAACVLEGESLADVIAVIDADLAKARGDFVPEEEELEDLVRELLLDEGLDEYDLEDVMFDHDERYVEARERAIDDLTDLELAPAVELSQYVYDLWHALGADINALRSPLPTPGEARALRQEADRARAELPQAA